MFERLRKRLAGAAIALAMTAAAIGAAAAYEGGPVAHGGTIEGVVLYGGKPPPLKRLAISKDRDVCGAHPLYDESLVVARDGGIANAVVTLPDIAKGEPMAPLKNVIFDQRGCEYVPHVIAFPAGSTIKIVNSDGILHSIHTESTVNPVVDMAQPGFKKTISITVAKPEAIKVTCDAHNWMEGWWYATANPYYAVTDAHGRFSISNVPPGTYTIEVWQEKLGTAREQVAVTAGGVANVKFTLKPR